jgi:protein-S-isoprenylcysteine O-methyltransferase Ste14
MLQLTGRRRSVLGTLAGGAQLSAGPLGGPQGHHVVGDSRSNRSPSVPDVANLGLARPPLIYLSSIVLGMVIYFAWPARLVPPAISTPVGAIVTLAAIALFISAVRVFRAAGTPIPGNRPATTIVRTGPYRFSRNPIYLAFSFFQLGLSLWANSLGLLFALVPAVALMSLVVIPREERYLEARFPSEYLPYKASVRRWL